ncbi:MAG: xanthine dehydrogenase family protein subunit M [Bdellovibrionota bacterium]
MKNLVKPSSLKEALTMLNTQPGVFRPFAGGTDLMVLLKAGKLEHKNFLSILHFDELRGITKTDTHLAIGALTTFYEIQDNPLIKKFFPVLAKASSHIGAWAIQNRATIGGNIANASPAADSSPALLAYDAEIDLVSVLGVRTIPYSTFHLGYKKLASKPTELIAAIRLPIPQQGLFQYFSKVGARAAQAISKVSFAGIGALSSNKVSHIRIAMGSVAPTPIRCLNVETALTNQPFNDATIRAAVTALTKDITPIDDIRSTAFYRSLTCANLLNEFLLKLCGTG